MPEPRDLVEELERGAELPEGVDERFVGYGVMAAPFSSGHILCMRRFPASSVGPAYTSVWHHDPDGRWTFYQNVPPEQACPRFFGSALAEAHERNITLEWTGPRSFRIAIGDELEWDVSLAPTAMTRLMNAIGGLMPDALWRNFGVLNLMAAFASLALRAGRLGLVGRVPNGQRFAANPRLIWSIPASRAVERGQDLGSLGPLPVQARLGDFWIPQRALFAIGRAFFEPFDGARHSSMTSKVAGD